MILTQFISAGDLRLQLENVCYAKAKVLPASRLRYVFYEQFTVYSFQFNIMHSTLCFSIDCRAADMNCPSRERVAGDDIVQ